MKRTANLNLLQKIYQFHIIKLFHCFTERTKTNVQSFKIFYIPKKKKI